MHKRKIAHRDIKPDNILTMKPGADGLFDVKLTDFGFSCFFDPTNSAENLQIGTQKFMAPELWSEQTKYDNNVDCWAVGILTYLLFAGVKPFDGNRITENLLKKKILYDEPTFKEKIW